MPRVTLMSVASGNKKANGKRKLRKLVAFVLGVKGRPGNAGMPTDMFRLVLDMPPWDLLRRRGAGICQQLEG